MMLVASRRRSFADINLLIDRESFLRRAAPCDANIRSARSHSTRINDFIARAEHSTNSDRPLSEIVYTIA